MAQHEVTFPITDTAEILKLRAEIASLQGLYAKDQLRVTSQLDAANAKVAALEAEVAEKDRIIAALRQAQP